MDNKSNSTASSIMLAVIVASVVMALFQPGGSPLTLILLLWATYFALKVCLAIPRFTYEHFFESSTTRVQRIRRELGY
jgi:hypothetical protein